MDIAGLVRAARLDAHLSQKALAARAGTAASVVSRVEAGHALPSLALLDRVLAACGRDVQWRLVQRHADLDELFARLAARAPLERLKDLDLRCGAVVEALAPVGVLVGGAWAAALHGVPREHDRGRLWLPDDEQAVGEVIAVLRRYMVHLLEDGRPVGAAYDPELLQRHPDASWLLGRVTFRLTVLGVGQEWPAEQRLVDREVTLRVVAELGPDDGARPEVLERWREWRASGRTVAGSGHLPAC